MAGVLALLLLPVLGLIVFALWPLRLDVNVQAQGRRDGGWLAAGGVEFGVVSAAICAARGIAPSVTLQLCGMRCYQRKLAWAVAGAPKPRTAGAARTRSFWWSRLTAGEALEFALQIAAERRHFRLRYLVLDVHYGFRDPILTGRLFGALCALSGALPAPIEIRQRPRWDFEDGWELSFDARAVMRPLLVMFDLVGYVVRMAWQRSFGRRKALANARG